VFGKWSAETREPSCRHASVALSVGSDTAGNLSISVEWSDGKTAAEVAEAAREGFLRGRHAAEVSHSRPRCRSWTSMHRNARRSESGLPRSMSPTQPNRARFGQSCTALVRAVIDVACCSRRVLDLGAHFRCMLVQDRHLGLECRHLSRVPTSEKAFARRLRDFCRRLAVAPLHADRQVARVSEPPKAATEACLPRWLPVSPRSICQTRLECLGP